MPLSDLATLYAHLTPLCCQHHTTTTTPILTNTRYQICTILCDVQSAPTIVYPPIMGMCVPLQMMLAHSVVRYNDSSTMLERERITQVHDWHGIRHHLQLGIG